MKRSIGVFLAIAAWITIISYITHEQIGMVFTGSIISTYYDRYSEGYDAGAAKARLAAFTILTGLTLLYLLFVRRFVDKSDSRAAAIFSTGTFVLCLLMCPFLVSGATLLVQYIRCEGLTFMRAAGLVYSVLCAASLVGIYKWSRQISSNTS